MTLRRQAEQLYINGFQDGQDRRQFMTTRTLAFLDTPELKEIQNIKEQFESLIEEHQRYVRQAEEWREKAKKWDEFVEDNRDLLSNINEIMALRKENAELKEGLNTILTGLTVEDLDGGEEHMATPEEVREAIEEGFLGWGADGDGKWGLRHGNLVKKSKGELL